MSIDDYQLTGADGLKINGVLITELDGQSSTSVNANDKVAQINDKTDQHGVVATGFNQIVVTVDMSNGNMQTASDSTINGITVDLYKDATVADLIEGINAALAGKIDIVASMEADTGKLVLTIIGLTISIDDTGSSLYTAVTYTDGSAVTTALSSGAASWLYNPNIS